MKKQTNIGSTTRKPDGTIKQIVTPRGEKISEPQAMARIAAGEVFKTAPPSGVRGAVIEVVGTGPHRHLQTVPDGIKGNNLGQLPITE